MMRFRKRIRVFPGFHVNFSSSGISSNIGVRGASITFSKKGTYLNTGIPGTGFSDRIKLDPSPANSHSPASPSPARAAVNLPGEIRSSETEELNSSDFKELRETLLNAYREREEIREEVVMYEKKLRTLKNIHTFSCVLLVGFFIKYFKDRIADTEEYISDVKGQQEACVVDLDVLFEGAFNEKYAALTGAFKNLITSEKIWDITSEQRQDRRVTRSAAEVAVTRSPVSFKWNHIDIIKSQYPAFHFENRNGGDLYIYPAFILVRRDRLDFSVIDIKDLDLRFARQNFIEEEKVPSDAVVVSETWHKVNKNGQPDKRFKYNYKIPVVKYGEITLHTATGLNEAYSFSSYEKSNAFAEAFSGYQEAVI